MRILQVAHGYPPQEWGGAELVTATLAQALAERGHSVTVFARMADPEAEEFSVRPDEADMGDGVHVVRIVNNLSQVSHFRLEYDNPFLDEAFHQSTDRHPARRRSYPACRASVRQPDPGGGPTWLSGCPQPARFLFRLLPSSSDR